MLPPFINSGKNSAPVNEWFAGEKRFSAQFDRLTMTRTQDDRETHMQDSRRTR